MVGTHSILSIVEAISNVDIMVGNSLDWLILLVCPEERICNSFEGCSVPVYECLFIRLGTCLPFFDFEVVVMDRLRVAPLQLHPGPWDFVKVFQLYVEYKSWKPFLKLFFFIFFPYHVPFRMMHEIKDWSSLAHRCLGLALYLLTRVIFLNVSCW